MRKELESLIFEGALEEEFKMFGRTWKIKTLTTEEQIDATANTSGYDNLTRINALKVEMLTFSLIKVNNIELNDYEETNEFIKSLPPQAVSAIFSKFEELQEKQEKALTDLDEVKN